MSTVPSTQPLEGDFAWEVATLFPEQGEWSEEAYLQLTDGTNRRIEYTDGRLEFLPMPTEIHESLIEFLYFALDRHPAKDSAAQISSARHYLFAQGSFLRPPQSSLGQR